MSPDDILQTFIQVRHVAIHAAAAFTAEWVMRVCLPGVVRLELLVAFQAQRIILIRSQCPLLTNSFVGAVAVNTAQL